MKLRTFILTGIAMLLLSAATNAEVIITFEENDLIASSNQKGVEGFKGCTADKLEKMPAYTFRLLKKDMPSNNAACKIPSGKWRQVDEQTSNNGSVIFEDLPDGEYKVQCLIGKPIGCLIDETPEGYPDRSIVYEQELSESTGAASKKERNESNALTSIEAGLLIFPNPAQDEINVQIKDSQMKSEVVLVIYDMQGKQLYSRNYTLNSEGNDEVMIRTDGYPSGTYLLRVFDVDGVSVEGKFSIIRK